MRPGRPSTPSSPTSRRASRRAAPAATPEASARELAGGQPADARLHGEERPGDRLLAELQALARRRDEQTVEVVAAERARGHAPGGHLDPRVLRAVRREARHRAA